MYKLYSVNAKFFDSEYGFKLQDFISPSYMALNSALNSKSNSTTLSAEGPYFPLSIELTGTAAGDTINGTSGSDTLIGLGGDDTLNGLDGFDILFGGDGADTLNGGNDPDHLYGGLGADILNGGAGEDFAIYTDSNVGVIVNLQNNTGANGTAEGDTFISIEGLSGSEYDDELYGDGGGNHIQAHGGNDNLNGESGDDQLYAGEGNDNLYGGHGQDSLFGENGDDWLSGGSGIDTLTGGAGADTFVIFNYIGAMSGEITDLEFADTILFYGATGPEGFQPAFIGDAAFSGVSGELRYEKAGGQTMVQFDLTGNGVFDEQLIISNGEFDLAVSSSEGNGNFRLKMVPGTTGTPGDDVLVGTSGDDVIDGLTGNDLIFSSAGIDTINGGDGIDYIDFSGEASAIFLGNFTDGVTLVTPSGTILVNSIEGIIGTQYDDFIGTNISDTRNVMIDGGDGNDALRGGAGDDALYGGAGDDYLSGHEGVDSFDGGAGNDRVSFYNLAATQGVIADLRNQTITNDGFGNAETMTGIEHLGTGTAFADVFYGDDGNNLLLTAGYGNLVNGYGGDDSIQTQAAGNFDGGDGVDTLSLTGGSKFVVDNNADGLADEVTTLLGFHIDLSLGQIVNDGFGDIGTVINIENLNGTHLNDTLIGDNHNNMIDGGDGDDIIDGGSGDDDLNGSGGNDTVSGGLGNDTVRGGAGDDTLNGGDGNDVLFGRTGYDTQTGGTGVDTFMITEYIGGMSGLITDFELIDTILFYGATGVEGFQPSFIGNAGFSGISGELRYEKSGGQTVIQFDLTGDGIANEQLFLANGEFDLFVSYTEANGNFALQIDDAINGTPGDDVITGTPGQDTLNGLGGNDVFIDGEGDDFINGGDGLDIIDYSGNATGLNLGDFGDGASLFDGTGVNTVTSIEGIIGSQFDDRILASFGDTRNLYIDGGDGNDVLRGALGDDEMHGGAGDDYLSGGEGVDSYHGGAGYDRVSLYWYRATEGAVADLRTQTISNDGFGNAETMVGIEGIGGGTAHVDFFDGDDNDNTLISVGVGDVINGYGGDDFIQAEGAGTYDGGDGIDSLLFTGGEMLVVDNNSDGFADFAYTTNGVNVDLGLGLINDDGFGNSGTAVNFENLYGTQFDDILTGNGNGNTIDGGAGDDIINGGAGGDTLLGSDGNDSLDGGLGFDVLTGGTGSDTYVISRYVGAMSGQITDLEDVDTIQFFGATGVEGFQPSFIADAAFSGVSGELRYEKSGGQTLIEFDLTGDGIANEQLVVLNGEFNLYVSFSDANGSFGLQIDAAINGTPGDDVLNGTPGDDIINGLAGNDTFIDGDGNDIIDGGDGLDIIDYSGSAFNINISDLTDGQTLFDGSGSNTITSIEGVIGTQYADTILASFGETRNVFIDGGAGDDVLRGGLGDDELRGGDGDDYLSGGEGVDSYHGGTGHDRVSLYWYRATEGAVADLRTQTISNDGFGNVETMVGIEGIGGGTAHVDFFDGDDNENTLISVGVGDVINGYGGDDFFQAEGAGTYDGGDGIDVLLFTGGEMLVVDNNADGFADFAYTTNGVNVDLGLGLINDDGFGNTGTVVNFEDLAGTNLNDILVGSVGANTIEGRAGSDIIDGRAGDDILYGGEGSDYVNGGDGNDIIIMDDSIDTVRGGDGADIFDTVRDIDITDGNDQQIDTRSRFNGDTIQDFSVGDLITFKNGTTLTGSFVFTSDGVGGGSLDMLDGNVLHFTAVAAGTEFVTIQNAQGTGEIRLVDIDDGLVTNVSEDRFDFRAGVTNADITIDAGVTVGTDVSGLFGNDGQGVMFLAGDGEHNVTNNGVLFGLIISSEQSSYVNNGTSGGVNASSATMSTDSSFAYTNSSSGVVFEHFAAISLNGGDFLNPATPSLDDAVITNDGLIESYFNIILGETDNTLEINNSGTMRVIDNPNAGPSASLGVLAAGRQTTVLNNDGVIEVTSANGGFVGNIEAVAVNNGVAEGTSYVLNNTGRISSAGLGVIVGGISENDVIYQVTITNTATGIIESDTNNNNLSGESAIEGGLGRVILDPTSTFETLTTFSIDNAGQITGDIALYDDSSISILGFTYFDAADGLHKFQIAGGPLVVQDVDGTGAPVNDGNGVPVFTPSAIVSTVFGTVNFHVDGAGIVRGTDGSGDPILLMPDQDDLNRGAFADSVVNSGEVDGDVLLGVGNDTYTGVGNGEVTGTIDGGRGNDVLQGGDLADRLDGGSGNDIITGGAGDDIINGGSGSDIIDGGAGDDIIDGGADSDYVNGGDGNDIIIMDGSIDTVRGGEGADIFDTVRDLDITDLNDQFVDTRSMLNGDTIQDFTIGDIITFKNQYFLTADITFTEDGMGGGTLDLQDGNVLNFTAVAAGTEFISVQDRYGTSEIRIVDVEDGLTENITQDRFEFTSRVTNADITVDAGVVVGDDISGVAGADGQGRIRLSGGEEHNVVNNGTLRGAVMYGEDGTFTNNNIGGRVTALSETMSTDSRFEYNNSATGEVTGTVQALNLVGGNVFGNTNPSIDNAIVNNDGLIEVYFNIIQGGTDNTLEINNSGIMRVIDNPNPGSEASLGVVAEGGQTTVFNNSGVLEILSTNGGISSGQEAVAVLGGTNDGTSYELVNSGRISSTGVAVRLGGISDTNKIYQISITNTATGVIEADTNGNGGVGEAAIQGGTGYAFTDPSSVYEILNAFDINNAGLIDGDIILYDLDFNSTLGFTHVDFSTGLHRLLLAGMDDPIDQDTDEMGDPVFDVDGNPVFTPGTLVSTVFGTVNYFVENGVVRGTDSNGELIEILPDQDDLDRGAFADTVLNSGVVDGDILLGVGNDTYSAMGTGEVTGTVDGGRGDDILEGGDLDDRLDGGLGNDILIGRGGNDDLIGGAGYDTANYANAAGAVAVYLNSNAAFDDGDGGVDTLFGIEAVIGSAFDDVLAGDDAGNTLGGGFGNDTLVGGLGDDFMVGGAGDDTYYVDDLGDIILEFVGEGSDVVFASVDYTLAANIETAFSQVVAAAAVLIGNDLDNTLVLNSSVSGSAVSGGGGNDTIYVQNSANVDGGAGNDVLVMQGDNNIVTGGLGDDTYILYGNGNIIAEGAGEGIDTVYSYAGIAFMGENVETLVLQAVNAAGVGSDQANTIIGNASSNVISGLGGSDYIYGGAGDDSIAGGDGIDFLQGNAGFDTYFYNSVSEAGDVIQDWVAAEDGFAFSASAFGMSAGDTLVDGVNFISGTDPLAAAAQATFLWDSDDTALYYDADGSGAGAAVLVADLQAFTDVTIADFVFF